MSELIIPAGVKADYRPYRNATTPALLYELQQRGIVVELAGRIMMPRVDIETAKADVRQAQFKAMAAQMGEAIANSPFCLCQTHMQDNLVDPETAPQDEILSMSVMLCKHPLREVLEQQQQAEAQQPHALILEHEAA